MIQARLDQNGGNSDPESEGAHRAAMESNGVPSKPPTRAGLGSRRGSLETPGTMRGRRNYFWEQPRRKLAIFDYDRDDPNVVNVAKLDLLKAQFSQAMQSKTVLDELWEQIDINASGTVGLQEWMIWVKSKFGCLAQLKPSNRAYRDTLRAQEQGKFDTEDDIASDSVEVEEGGGGAGFDASDPNLVHRPGAVDYSSDLMRELHGAAHLHGDVLGVPGVASRLGTAVSPILECEGDDDDGGGANALPTIDVTNSGRGGTLPKGASIDAFSAAAATSRAGPSRMATIDFESIGLPGGGGNTVKEFPSRPGTDSDSKTRGNSRAGRSRGASRSSASGLPSTPDTWRRGSSRAGMMTPRKSALELLVQDGGMLRRAFPFFITRLFRMSQLWFAFQYLDVSKDDRVDLDEYMKGRRKFRTALDLDLEKRRQDNMEPEERQMVREQEFGKMCDVDQESFGWSRIAHWYMQQLERGFVNGMGEGWANNTPPELYKQLHLDKDLLDAEPGATLDLDDFCDLVLYCHYNSRVHTIELFGGGFGKLPGIGVSPSSKTNSLKMKKVTSRSSMDV